MPSESIRFLLEENLIREQLQSTTVYSNDPSSGTFQKERALMGLPAYRSIKYTNHANYMRTSNIILNITAPVFFEGFEQVLMFLFTWSGFDTPRDKPYCIYYRDPESKALKLLPSVEDTLISRKKLKAQPKEKIWDALSKAELSVDSCYILDIVKLFRLRDAVKENKFRSQPEEFACILRDPTDIKCFEQNVRDAGGAFWESTLPIVALYQNDESNILLESIKALGVSLVANDSTDSNYIDILSLMRHSEPLLTAEVVAGITPTFNSGGWVIAETHELYKGGSFPSLAVDTQKDFDVDGCVSALVEKLLDNTQVNKLVFLREVKRFYKALKDQLSISEKAREAFSKITVLVDMGNFSVENFSLFPNLEHLECSLASAIPTSFVSQSLKSLKVSKWENNPLAIHKHFPNLNYFRQGPDNTVYSLPFSCFGESYVFVKRFSYLTRPDINKAFKPGLDYKKLQCLVIRAMHLERDSLGSRCSDLSFAKLGALKYLFFDIDIDIDIDIGIGRAVRFGNYANVKKILYQIKYNHLAHVPICNDGVILIFRMNLITAVYQAQKGKWVQLCSDENPYGLSLIDGPEGLEAQSSEDQSRLESNTLHAPTSDKMNYKVQPRLFDLSGGAIDDIEYFSKLYDNSDQLDAPKSEEIYPLEPCDQTEWRKILEEANTASKDGENTYIQYQSKLDFKNTDSKYIIPCMGKQTPIACVVQSVSTNTLITKPLKFYRCQHSDQLCVSCDVKGKVWVRVLFELEPYTVLNASESLEKLEPSERAALNNISSFLPMLFKFSESGSVSVDPQARVLFETNIPLLVRCFASFKEGELAGSEHLAQHELANALLAQRIGDCAHRAFLFSKLFNAICNHSVSYVIKSETHERVLVSHGSEKVIYDLGGGSNCSLEILPAPVIPETYETSVPYTPQFFPHHRSSPESKEAIHTKQLVQDRLLNKGFRRPILIVCKNLKTAKQYSENILAHLPGQRFLVQNHQGLKRKILRYNSENQRVLINSELTQTLSKPSGFYGLVLTGDASFLCSINSFLDYFRNPIDSESEWNAQISKDSVPIPFGTQVFVVLTQHQLNSLREDFKKRFEQAYFSDQLTLCPTVQTSDVLAQKIEINLRHGLEGLSKYLLDSSFISKLQSGCHLKIINPPLEGQNGFDEYEDFVLRIKTLKQLFIQNKIIELAHNSLKIIEKRYLFKNYKYIVEPYHPNSEQVLPDYDVILNEVTLECTLKRINPDGLECDGWLKVYKNKMARLWVSSNNLQEDHFDKLLSDAKSINCHIVLIIDSQSCPLNVLHHARSKVSVGAAALASSESAATPVSRRGKAQSSQISFIRAENKQYGLKQLKTKYPEAITVSIQNNLGSGLLYFWKQAINEGEVDCFYETEVLTALKAGKTVILYGMPSYELTQYLVYWSNPDQCQDFEKFSGRLIILSDFFESIPECFNYSEIKLETSSEGSSDITMESGDVFSHIESKPLCVFEGGKKACSEIENRVSLLHKIYTDYSEWKNASDLIEGRLHILYVPFAEVNPDNLDFERLYLLALNLGCVLDGEKLIKVSKQHRVVLIVEKPCELTEKYLNYVVSYPDEAVEVPTFPEPSSEDTVVAKGLETEKFCVSNLHTRLITLLRKGLESRAVEGSLYQGLCISGPSQIGKTQTVVNLLKALKIDYEELAVNTEESALEVLKRAYGEGGEAGEAGKVLVINELNTLSHMKKFWVKLMECLAVSKPGFYIISTQNPTSFPGRCVLPKRLQRHLIQYNIESLNQADYRSMVSSINPRLSEAEVEEIVEDFEQALKKSRIIYTPNDLYLFVMKTRTQSLETLRIKAIDSAEEVRVGSAGAAAASASASASSGALIRPRAALTVINNTGLVNTGPVKKVRRDKPAGVEETKHSDPVDPIDSDAMEIDG